MVGSSFYFSCFFLGIFFLFLLHILLSNLSFFFFLVYQAYGDSSFQDCKQASEEAMATITKNLQVYSSFPIKHMDGGAMDGVFVSYFSSIFFGHLDCKLFTCNLNSVDAPYVWTVLCTWIPDIKPYNMNSVSIAKNWDFFTWGFEVGSLQYKPLTKFLHRVINL